MSRDTARLVAFSDGVFAITITLLVLEIRPPTDDGSLLHGLLALWPSYLAYAVTYLFIVLAESLRSGDGQRTAVAFYGIAFAVAALTFNAVWQCACRRRLLNEALSPSGATAIGRRFQIAVCRTTRSARGATG